MADADWVLLWLSLASGALVLVMVIGLVSVFGCAETEAEASSLLEAEGRLVTVTLDSLVVVRDLCVEAGAGCNQLAVERYKNHKTY